MPGPIRPDHAKYSGCDREAGTMQLGITTAKANAIRTKVSRSLPANQSRFDVIALTKSNAECSRAGPMTPQNQQDGQPASAGTTLGHVVMLSVSWSLFCFQFSVLALVLLHARVSAEVLIQIGILNRIP